MSDILDPQMDSNVVPITDQWVNFQVRDLDDAMILSLHQEAQREQISTQEVMRQRICAYLGFDCVRSSASARKDEGSGTRQLRLQPELHEALKIRARTEGLSMQVVVKAALGA